MKLVYRQPYKGNRQIASWWGKPGKKHFEYDVIKVEITDGYILWMTPDEAADIIRALSAALHHWLVNDESVKHIPNAKNARYKSLKEDV